MPLPRSLARFNRRVTNRLLGPVIALTYGPETEWVRNVVAAGSCDFVTRRETLHLVEPVRFNDPARSVVPRMVGWVLGSLRSSDFLELRVSLDARRAPQRQPAEHD